MTINDIRRDFYGGTSAAEREFLAAAKTNGFNAAHLLGGTRLLAPTGALAETLPRGDVGLNNQTVLLSGRLTLAAVVLSAGKTVSSISFLSGTTALATGTNQWFGLFNSSRAALRFTSNDTSTAWAANTAKTLNLTSSYTIMETALYYIGIMVAATTVPSLCGVGATAAAIHTLPPIISGTCDTGLTTVPALPFTASALTGVSVRPYGWVS